jgi:hypothetical protein
MSDPHQDRLDDECQQADILHSDASTFLFKASEALKKFRIFDKNEANNMFLKFCKDYLNEKEEGGVKKEKTELKEGELPF